MQYKALSWYIKTSIDTPFKWGEFDCCLFACNCVIALMGVDPGKAYRGRYSTAIGAKRALTKYADGTIEGAFNQVFGEFKPRLNLGRGDLVLVATELGNAVGVISGAQIWVTGPAGLTSLPLNKALGGWQVKNMNLEAD